MPTGKQPERRAAICRKFILQNNSPKDISVLETEFSQRGGISVLNLLEDYISHSLPEQGEFETNPNLLKKVNPEGEFLSFYGNTVVFLLEDRTKKLLAELQSQLYKAAGDMLSQPLHPDTFHMTLHDLGNSTELTADLCRKMEETKKQTESFLALWRAQPPLRMKATWLFNMVNTSIVLGLAPADQETAFRLDALYTAMESIVPLGYGLTPHITMAYFRPGRYFPGQLRSLQNALHPIELELELHLDQIVHQTFTYMNLYQSS